MIVRIGVIIDTDPQPEWVRHVLERVQGGPHELAFVRDSSAPADVLWTIEQDLATMTAVLRRGDEIIASTTAAQRPESRERARTRLGWRTASMIEHALQRAEPERRAPANRQPPTANRFLAYLREVVRYRFMREHWSIAYQFGNAPFRELVPPRNRIWADPFVVAEGDRAWIFVEELVYPVRRGFISVLEVRRDGTWSGPRPVLERPYHLSYPCVFRWDGAWFMLPETSANRTIELYRCTDFPWKWELDTVLMHDVRAVDSTIFEAHGRWWLYTATPGSDRDKDFDRLWLHHAPSPRGPWAPHRLNPLLCDVAGGRPAGRPFLRDGRLLRAGQIGTPWYGYAMQLREIVTLTPEAWEEREISIFPPDWAHGLQGTHTLNVDDGVTVVDGLRWRWGRRR
jgi:hypothetical protein